MGCAASHARRQDSREPAHVVPDKAAPAKDDITPTSDGIANPNLVDLDPAAEALKRKLLSGSQDPSSASPRIADHIEFKGHGRVGKCRMVRHQEVHDKYAIDECVLGSGLSGIVRPVTAKADGKRFAMKTMKTTGVPQAQLQLLRTEIELHLKVDHPNIARLYEVYEEEGAVHLVMELCQGKELFAQLETLHTFDEARAAVLTQQMLEAVHYIHSHGVVHRDLKLENFVFATEEPDSRLKLIDWGLGGFCAAGQVLTSMQGTLYYVSPEVLDGMYDSKCDIWSLGVIVYMLLIGTPPFSGVSDEDIMGHIKRGRLPNKQCQGAAERWESVSKEARDFIRQLLTKDPEERPTAHEALSHPWITRLTAPPTSESPDCSPAAAGTIDRAVLRDLRSFAHQNVVKRAACALLSYTATCDGLAELEEQFKKLDTDHSGTIKLSTLATLLKEQLGLPESYARKVFAKLDHAGDDEIEWSDFIAVATMKQNISKESSIREVFNRLDETGSGYITLDNLRHTFGSEWSGVPVEEIYRQCNPDLHGRISFEEFSKLLMQEAADSESMMGSVSMSRELSQNGPSAQKSDPALAAFDITRSRSFIARKLSKSLEPIVGDGGGENMMLHRAGIPNFNDDL